MNRLISGLLLATLCATFLAPHVHAEESAPIRPGYWMRLTPEFAKIQDPNAAPGVMKEVKESKEDGGKTTFNKTNMEVKCFAERADGESPKSASGSATYESPYKWVYLTGTTSPPPPDRYFVVDTTIGTACFALPVMPETEMPADKTPGKATGSGKSGQASNSSVPNSTFEQEVKRPNQTVDSVIGGIRYDKMSVQFPVLASAVVESLQEIEKGMPTGEDGVPPPTPSAAVKNLSLGCRAEGRTYVKTSEARPYGRTNW